MKDDVELKLKRICVLNDDQRLQNTRQITVYGYSGVVGSKDFLVDSLLKALALGVCELNNSSCNGVLDVEVKGLSDHELLQAIPYQFNPKSISFSGLAVWNYS